MYTSFHIQNFRGFEDFKIEDLARINLFAGKNNVGKTALLEALYLHGRAYNPQEALNLNQVRGLEFVMASDPSLIFRMRDTSRNILIEARDQKSGHRSIVLRIVQEADELAQISLRIRANGHSNGLSSLSENIQVLALDYKVQGREEGTAYLVRTSPKEVSLSGVLTPPIKMVFIPAQGRPTSTELAKRFSNLEITNQHQVLLEMLTIIEPQIKRISVLYRDEQAALWGEVNRTLLPLNLLGDGLNRLVNLVTAIIENRDGIVLIDELENGLHHSVLTDVWKAIATAAREFNVQIFATTHSLEMIRAAHEAFKDEDPYDFRLHRLDRDEKTGKITAVTYDEDILEAAVEANFEVR
ncbi:MAG: AAA family ATPase [Anaerolineae bacterium]|nr:AAA family ATPase [Anaerolineae bacterium]